MIGAFIDGKNILSLPRHGGLLVDMVNEGIDYELDGVAVDLAIQMKGVKDTS